MGMVEEMRNLALAIGRSHQERTASISEIKKTVSQTIKGFAKSRKQMATDLRKELDKYKSTLSNQVEEMLEKFRSSLEEMAVSLRKNLVKNKKDRKEMAKELNASLSLYVKGIKDGVKETLSAFDNAQEKIRKELEAFSEAWRKGISGKGKEVKKVVKPKKRAKEKEEVKEEIEGKEEQIISVLRENPAGISLSQIADALGVHFVTLSGTIKDLVDEGRVEKEDNLYLLVE